MQHIFTKNKYNMPAHMYLNAHRHAYTHTHNMNNKVKHRVNTTVKRIVDFKPTSTKMLSPLLHREVLLTSL